jgi:hypothetical protein
LLQLFSYERASIVEWLQKHDTSPATGYCCGFGVIGGGGGGGGGDGGLDYDDEEARLFMLPFLV